MSVPLPDSIERAAVALIQALGLPYCVQVTINLSPVDGQILSIEPRLKLQRAMRPRTKTRDRTPEVA